jgi:hypothetical protein
MEGLPEGMQEGLQEGLPEGLPEVLPDGLQEGLPEGPQEVLPEGLQEGLPEVLPEALPEALRASSPRKASGRASHPARAVDVRRGVDVSRRLQRPRPRLSRCAARNCSRLRRRLETSSRSAIRASERRASMPRPRRCRAGIPGPRQDVATSCGGGATQRHSLSTRQADGTPVAVEEDAAAMTKLLLVSLVAKSCKVVVGLLVGEEEKQTQEFAMDTVPM